MFPTELPVGSLL